MQAILGVIHPWMAAALRNYCPLYYTECCECCILIAYTD